MTQPDGPATPTLALVLRRVADLLGTTTEDIIADRGARVDRARDVFCWLAAEVTSAPPEAIGYAIAVGVEAVEHARDRLDLERRDDRICAAWLREAAIEVRAEAGLVRRKLLDGAPDRDAAATARRVLGGERQRVNLPVIDLVHLAASFELLVQRVAYLETATTAVAAAAYTPGERAARAHRDKAERALFHCIHPHPAQKVSV